MLVSRPPCHDGIGKDATAFVFRNAINSCFSNVSRSYGTVASDRHIHSASSCCISAGEPEFISTMLDTGPVYLLVKVKGPLIGWTNHVYPLFGFTINTSSIVHLRPRWEMTQQKRGTRCPVPATTSLAAFIPRGIFIHRSLNHAQPYRIRVKDRLPLSLPFIVTLDPGLHGLVQP